MIKQLPFEDYSAVIVAGDDELIHEVVNGMLMRQDNMRIPLGFLPSNKTNDIAKGLHITDIDDALNFIKKGHIVSMDVTKILIDV